MVPVVSPVVDHSALEIVIEPIVTGTFPVLLMVAGRVEVAWRTVDGKESDVGVICHDADAAAPVPWIAMFSGDEGSLLVIVRVAFAAVVLDAENVTVKLLLVPGAN